MKVGDACTFYHEGGSGEKRWVVGWRYGVIVHAPIKGKNKSAVQIELPVPQWTWDDDLKEWRTKPPLRVWVPLTHVNEPGDYVFHGNDRLAEEVAERAEKKEQDQAAADKRAKPKVSKPRKIEPKEGPIGKAARNGKHAADGRSHPKPKPVQRASGKGNGAPPARRKRG